MATRVAAGAQAEIVVNIKTTITKLCKADFDILMVCEVLLFMLVLLRSNFIFEPCFTYLNGHNIARL